MLFFANTFSTTLPVFIAESPASAILRAISLTDYPPNQKILYKHILILTKTRLCVEVNLMSVNNKLFCCFSVKLRSIGFRFRLCQPDNAVFVMGGRIKSKSFNSSVSETFIILCWAPAGTIITEPFSSEYSFPSMMHFPFPFSKRKLIIVRMNFHPNFFPWHQIHQHQLTVLSGIQNFSEILIF